MSVLYERQTGIPAPVPRKRTVPYGKLANALRSLAVGDSILIPIRLQAAIWGISRRIGIKATTKKENSDEARVWRVE